MTFQIDLSPEKETMLREEAARRGISADEYAKRLLEESLPAHQNRTALSLEEEERLFDELAEVGKHLPPSPPGETYSRETIYAEHD